MSSAIYLSVVVVATAGLVYELLAAAAASYLLGDSITQFSTVIGAYLFAMGIGSFLSRYVRRGVAARFVEVEIAVGLVGGWATTLLFVAFGQTPHFRVVLYGLVGVVGVLVGLEIPLLLRLLRGRLAFSELVARVLSLDYAGALVASLLFPLLLVPRLGLIRTSLLMGLANAAVGVWSTWLFRRELGRPVILRVLVLGGGDGLAAREILRYPTVASITLVDLDAEMTRLFAGNPLLRELNGGALDDGRLRVVNADAFIWLQASRETFDVAIVDFPDPHNFSLGKLYSRTFYRLLRTRLAPDGLAVVQATSPMFARRSFWCINETIRSAGLAVRPYHVYVPSFGEWGFVLAAARDWAPPRAYPPGLRFLTGEGSAALFGFPPDMAAVP